MSTTPNYSHTRSSGRESLAQTPADVDPTRTKTIRRRYAQALRGQLAALNPVIREFVRSRDLFGLRDEALQPSPPDPPNERVFEFATDAEKIERFISWLRRQERAGLLEVIERGQNRYIRAAYGRGVRHADAALRADGFGVPDDTLQTVFNTGVHEAALQRLFTRNFSELEGVTDAMNQQISRELADGFVEGVNPTEMADRITDRVNAIGKHRATVLARAEVIRAHSTATLNRFEEHGVDNITIQAEWVTAGDRRVCPICRALEGRVVTVQQAREETFDFTAGPDQPSSLSGSYSIQPPAHPQCRCAFLPVVS